MRKATFEERGLAYVSELALTNVIGLVEICKWNVANHVSLFRMSSGIFPWATKYKLTDLPDYDAIAYYLAKIGTYQDKIRFSFHPDHFVKLASEKNESLVESIKELEHHSEVMDLMGLPTSPQAKINIHIGGGYGDKPKTFGRFVNNLKYLSPNLASRLTIENDDKLALFTTRELWWFINLYDLDIPIVFDYHHHMLNSGDIGIATAAELAYETWINSGVKPTFHYSDSKRIYEDSTAKDVAHSDYIYNKIDDFGLDLDIMLETKMKDLALLRYRQEFPD